MPQYHFNVFQNETLIESIEVELADVAAARNEAMLFAGETIRGAGLRNGHIDHWHMQVADHTSLILFYVDFNITAASAVIKALD